MQKASGSQTQPNTEEELKYRISSKTDSIDICFALIKKDFLHAEDDLRDILKTSKKIFPIIAVTDKDKMNIIDKLYDLNVTEVLFDFIPEKIIETLNMAYAKEKTNEENQNSNYIINFYENKNLFIIDISGSILKENISALKMMFHNFLKDKLKTIKGVIYIFSNVNEYTINFKNIWPLIKIWNDMGINYQQISYLTNSKKLTEIITKFFGKSGMKLFPNLLEISKYFFPELAKSNEMELFEFSSQILSSPRKITGK